MVSAPMGIRIPVLALKGPRPSPLDDGGELTGAFYFICAKCQILFDRIPNTITEIPRR
jgi:hypothetical protein